MRKYMSSPFIKRVLHLGLILCLIVALVPFAVAQEGEEEQEKLPTDALKALYEAQMLMNEDQYDEAIARINEYLATKPLDIPARVYTMLGNCWYAKEDFEETRKAFEKAYEIDPTDANTLRNYAAMTYQTERFADAAVLFEKLFEVEDPGKPRSLWNAASAFYQAEDLKNCKRVLERLLKLPGTPDPQWYKLIIEVSYGLEQMAEVERYILEFLTLNPFQSYYWSLLSQVRLDRNDLKTGTSDLEIAYRIEAPKRQNQWSNLGELYHYVRAPLMEARSLKLAYKDKDDPKGYIRISRAYEDALRYDEALNTLNEGIKKNPSSADLFYEKGLLLYHAVRFREAIEAFRECVKLDRKRGEAYTLMGFAAWSLKDWDEARSAFADASRIPKYQNQANRAMEGLDKLFEIRDEFR
jgi:tetratricopeptide (TPR) repeat protein